MFLIRRNRSCWCCCLFFRHYSSKRRMMIKYCQFPRNELRVALNDLPRNILTHLDKLLCASVCQVVEHSKQKRDTLEEKKRRRETRMSCRCAKWTRIEVWWCFDSSYIYPPPTGGLEEGRKEIKKRKKEKLKRESETANRLHLLRRSLCRPSDQPETSTKRPFALPLSLSHAVCTVCVSFAAAVRGFPSHCDYG